jgi:hypothetical protein
MRIFVFLLFGIVSLSTGAWAAGGVYQCIPCPTGIDCPAGTNEADIATAAASQHAKDGVPVGSVIAIAINRGAEFDGWLLCDGQDIPVGAKYNALRGLLGDTYGAGKVPDFRGMFLRGHGSQTLASGKDNADTIHASGDIGDWQGDAIRNITGEWNAGANYTVISASGVVSSYYNGSSENGAYNSGGRLQFDAGRVVPTANEIRPVNYAVYYYIKY